MYPFPRFAYWACSARADLKVGTKIFGVYAIKDKETQRDAAAFAHRDSMMEQIVIRVKDKEKTMSLRKMLRTLDYVESVSEESETATSSTAPGEADKADFFAAAGIWQGRDITLDSIRQKAWPRQSEHE